MNAILGGGFADPPTQSAHAFRALLEAMARPGRIHEVTGAAPPAPISVAAGVALLTLTDSTTPLHLAGPADSEALRVWIGFHTGAPLVPADEAQFALGHWHDLQPLSRFRIGEPAYPDRSATLIVELYQLEPQGARLTGPGIRDEARLSLPEIGAFRSNRALFPLGLDFILTCGSRLAALPRSTIVEDI
ncbi:phosphonate C-P lyase system protein PhnH [Paracoccus sp. J56]|uniref:phosphonate C-P lyase system protein PhnH n=1 Tax=Paracoccus sp. J56 TaxID=935850 RepID=UPI000A0D1CEF|nr:phosphonate C-P lyase system protein PhnH [Paracoccus sp. J56]SMG22736.1 alpha-D-ribose 1-methylphosphonate 5-triphosphate synthase subunit PhnH [Paracoccus sp. J56]